MEEKWFLILDRQTSIVAVAHRVDEKTFTPGTFEHWAIRRAGFSSVLEGETGRYVFLSKMSGPVGMEHDPFSWGYGLSRTMGEAHRYIETNWHELKTGDVIDVEFIRGETKEKKVSEFVPSLVQRFRDVHGKLVADMKSPLFAGTMDPKDFQPKTVQVEAESK